MESFHKHRFVIGLTLTALLYVRSINALDIPAAAPKLPIFMGTVDGKSYFHDDTGNANWITANQICNASGLHLATITTAAQLTFLNGVHASGVLPKGCYWLGGREAREPRMFSWDVTGNDISSVISAVYDQLGRDYLACLAFCGSNPNEINALHCTMEHSNVGTFCET